MCGEDGSALGVLVQGTLSKVSLPLILMWICDRDTHGNPPL